jgi:hypothetical protein
LIVTEPGDDLWLNEAKVTGLAAVVAPDAEQVRKVRSGDVGEGVLDRGMAGEREQGHSPDQDKGEA